MDATGSPATGFSRQALGKQPKAQPSTDDSNGPASSHMRQVLTPILQENKADLRALAVYCGNTTLEAV